MALASAGEAKKRRGQLAGFVLRNILGIPLWVAGLEEIDLRQRIPGYGEYMKAVPRFFPCPGRKWEG